MDNYYAVIMAGGGGTRLWPVSRQARPKQLLHFASSESLFQSTVRRMEGLFPNERILVVTTQEQSIQLQEQCPQIPAENYLLEPLPRGTAAVVGLAAAALNQRDPKATMAVLTSDHFIGDEEKFRNLLITAYEVAQKHYLVTLGVAPTYAATGYGYIQSGESLGNFNGLEVYNALKFKEKPDGAQARQMLQDGNHSWNSGMFVWQVKDILAEFQRQMPSFYLHIQRIGRAWNGPERMHVLESSWSLLQANTIDYGVMEGAKKVAVIPANGLGWNDVGSWESIFEILPKDDLGNVVSAEQNLLLDTRDTLVYTTQNNRMIVTIGLKDLVIVDTGDVLLVSSRESSQKVRQVVGQLKQLGSTYI